MICPKCKKNYPLSCFRYIDEEMAYCTGTATEDCFIKVFVESQGYKDEKKRAESE